VYDLLLVINSNLGPISQRLIASFSYPLSFSTLVRSDTLRIYGKALWLPKGMKVVFHAANGEDLVILTCTVFD